MDITPRFEGERFKLRAKTEMNQNPITRQFEYARTNPVHTKQAEPRTSRLTNPANPVKVLDSEGQNLSTEDTKPRFISGFVVRQLAKDGVIEY